MKFAKPTIYLCPSCGRPMKKTNFSSYTVHHSTLYSDGVHTGHPHFTPELAKCRDCGALFFMHNLTEKKEEKRPEGVWDDYHFIDDPNLADYIKAVETGLAKTKEEEIQVRSCLWRALNDKVRNGTKSFDDSEMELWQQNCEKLLALLEPMFNEQTEAAGDDEQKIEGTHHLRITVMELKRNLGIFDECLYGLAKLPPSYDWLIKQFIKKCGEKERMVFVLNKTDDSKDEKAPTFLIEEFYDFLQNGAGDILVCIQTREGEPVQPEILYSGGANALLRRRPDQFVMLDEVHPNIRETLLKTKEVLVTEMNPGNRKEPPNTTTADPADSPAYDPKDVPGSFVREYTLNIRPVFETLESSETIADDGYPLFTALRAQVCAQKDKPIAEVIGREDYANLAAVLAREEDYTLLDKYFAENLPVNQLVSATFKTWRPTPLFYVTTAKVFHSLKDPIKMLHYLKDHGADLDMAGIEGDTPLGNHCLKDGDAEILKALLDAGADPNADTVLGDFTCKPLHLLLIPNDYDPETYQFTPFGANDVARAKLLVEAGADVNAEYDSEMTPLGMAITYGAGEERMELMKLLLDKGADDDATLRAMEKCAHDGNPEYYYAISDFYLGTLPGTSDYKNQEKVQHYRQLGDKATSPVEHI